MRRPLFLLVVVVLALTGCGADDEPVATDDGNGGLAGGDDLDTVEGEYVSVSVTEDGEALALFEGTDVSLGLVDGEVSASAGCNHLRGRYSIAGDVLVVDRLGMTERGCPAPGHERDRWLADLLTAGPAMTPRDEGLVLAAGDRSIELVDESVVNPDRDLVGTTWEVDGFVDGPDGAVTSTPADAGFVVFEENGFVTGSDGCNGLGYAEDAAPDPERSDLGKTYAVEGDTIGFDGDFVSTLVGCDDAAARSRFHDVLTGTVTFEIDGAKLTLRADDGTGVTYRATAP